MKMLLNKRLEATFVSVDGETQYGKGFITIEKQTTLITTNAKLKAETLKGLTAILINNHIIILIEGSLFSLNSSSFGIEYKYRFYEAIYYDTNSFEDKYSKIDCRILLLNNWFKRKYYRIEDAKDETHIKIENEESFILKYKQSTITLYYSSNINFGRSLKVDPITRLIIENEIELERYEQQEMLNYVINFYQCFFYKRFDLFNLSYSNKKLSAISHSYKIPYTTDVEFHEGGIMWFSFDEIKDDLQFIFENWMNSKEENSTIEELFSDAFNNTSSVNRFLSAIRSLEILSKRIKDKDAETKAKEWQKNIASNQVVRVNEKKFSQHWILKPFVLYNDSLIKISDSEIIDIINNRNYYTHRGYKIDGVLDASLLQRMTNKILGYSKTIFFLQLGIKKEMVKRVMNSFDLSYFNEPIDNEISSFYKKD
jgi:hypothetical protein